MKLIDTSSWIEYLRDSESEAGNRVEELVLAGDAAWCDLIAVELWHAVRGTREKRDLAELEREITLLQMDADAWQKARWLAVRCRDSGLTVPVADLIIAAVATHHGLEIEHCDRHFDKILPLAAKG
jgi:predicted nucleic acid-binding protein